VISLASNVIQFRDRTLGYPVAWLWNFGDGNTSTDRNPEHTYTQTDAPQSFTVTLLASDAFGYQSKVSKTVVIPAYTAPPAPYNPGLGNTFALDQGDGVAYISIDEFIPT
jgi:PKD repeat protein